MALNLKAVLGLDASGFALGIKQAQSQVKKFSNDLDAGFASRLKGMFGAAAVGEASRRTLDFVGHVNDLSLRLGISTDAVQKWDNALKQNGSSIDAAAGFFERLAVARQKALGGDAASLSAFRKLGVNQDELKTLGLEGVAKKIGDSIRTGDVQSLIVPLREVGGRAAGELVATFKSGLSELFDGTPLISAENIVELDELGDKFVLAGKKIMAVMGPILAFINRRLSEMKVLMTMVVGGPAAFVGSLMGGGSLKDAVTAWKQAGFDAADEFAADEEKKRKATENAKSPKATPPEVESAADKAATAAVEKATKDKSTENPLQLTSLQQVGAKVGMFSPMLTELQKNTAAVKELTKVTKDGIHRGGRLPQNSDAQYQVNFG